MARKSTLAVLTARPVEAGGTERTWLFVAFKGLNESESGDFFLDAASFALINSRIKKREIELVVDWEHQTMGGEFAAPDGKAPAAGFITELAFHESPATAPDGQTPGLYALVEWNDKGWESIVSREYRYISPVVRIEESKTAGDPARVTELHSVALTNAPAIDRMKAIAAKDSRFTPLTGGRKMPRKKTQAHQIEGDEQAALFNKLVAMLGLPEGADMQSVLEAAIAALTPSDAPADDVDPNAEHPEDHVPGEDEDEERENSSAAILAQVRELIGAAANKDVVPGLTALKLNAGSGSELKALKARVEKSEKREADQRFVAMCDQAATDGKISAHQFKKNQKKYRVLFDHGEDTLKEFFAESPEVVPQGADTDTDEDAETVSRETMIASATRVYKKNPPLGVKLHAHVAGRLRDAGLGKLTHAEKTALG